MVITSAALEAAFLTDFTDLTTALVVPLLAAYTLGEQLERRASYVALAATYVGAMAVEVIDHGFRANDVVLIAFYLLAAWFVGRSLRVRNALNVALREKTLRLDAEREETARAEAGRRARPDRARAPRRRRAQRERHGRPGRRRAADRASRPGAGARGAARRRGVRPRGAGRDAPPARRAAPRGEAAADRAAARA